MSAPLSVLVVEDEAPQREVLVYNLEAEGYLVQQATSGDAALEMAREDEPDLILLDWMLPEVSGIEVCRRLKSAPETRSIPVIMISAR
ncbi:response regulator, partial [Jannaschia sp.]|nr:response regulator [Jannaschia sp.]